MRSLGVAEVPVSVVRLTPAREKALNVLLNNREAQGRYDPGKLAVVLEELRELPEFGESGFEPGVLRLLTYEPDGGLTDTEEGDRVEVTVVMSRERYEQVQGRLSEVIGELGLECHVRR